MKFYFKRGNGKELTKYCTKESDYELLYDTDSEKWKEDSDDKKLVLFDTRK